ncbi:TPA: transposase [Neisseria meningitidis]
MPSENISDGILSVMLPNTVNNILSRLFQTAFEKQGVSVKYSGLTKIRTRRRSRRQYNSTARRGNAVLV